MSQRVLVVDDEPDIPDLFRQRLRRELRKGALDLVFAANGAEALQVVESAAPQVAVVLTDINMPVMDGLALLARLKQDRPDLPVIMISAYSDAENRDRALALGANDFIAKPVDFQAIRDLVAGNGRSGQG